MKISRLILPMALAATAAAPISMVACSSDELKLKIDISDHTRIIINESPKTIKKKKGFEMKGIYKPLTPGMSQLICDVFCNKKDVSDQTELVVQAPVGEDCDWTLTVPGDVVVGDMTVAFSTIR